MQLMPFLAIGEMAIDVMVKSPHARGAGVNPQLEGVQSKIRRYQNIHAELQAEGIVYNAPLVWSSYGAPDPGVSQALQVAAAKAPRTTRAGDPSATLKRWRARISVEIWRRCARMAQRCLRPLADPEHTFEQHRGAEDEDDLLLYDWQWQ